MISRHPAVRADVAKKLVVLVIRSTHLNPRLPAEVRYRIRYARLAARVFQQPVLMFAVKDEGVSHLPAATG
jgi:hypothetical protein